MRKGKHGIFKLLFIIFSVVVMVCLEQLLVVSFNIAHPTSVTILLSGSVWAFIANVIFDKVVKQKEVHKVDEQLQEVLKGLQELKEIINR